MEQNIPLPNVVLDPVLQVRERLDETWVEELMELYRGLHAIDPVLVVFDGARYLLVDGWHRVEAQRRIEPSNVIATEVIDASKHADPMCVAKTRAAMANRGAGLRRTDGDKKRAILLLRSTSAGRKMTHDELAKQVGVSRSRVTQVLSEGEADVSANNGNKLYGGTSKPQVAALWAQVDAALKADPGKPDTHHARDLGCEDATVRRRREALGLPKSDSKRWRENSARERVAEELKKDPSRANRAIASTAGSTPGTVAKLRDELGLGKAPARNQHAVVACQPSAPVNPKRTDDPREQGAEVIQARPLRPPPTPRRDVVTEMMQLFERADRLDRQAFITAVYRRWPEYIQNAVDEDREEEAVLQ